MTFPLGRVLATPGALAALAECGQVADALLSRHVGEDWGDLDDFDRMANNWSLLSGGRLFSAYTLTNDVKVWVITEADRSATTLLLPSEY